MPVYSADINYIAHAHTEVKHKLRVEEIPDVPNNRSELTISIVRTNTGSSTVDGGREAFTYTVNGTTVNDFEINVAAIAPGASIQVGIIKTYIPHDANGAASFTVKAKYKCDYWEGWGAFSQFWTRGTAELSAAATQINQSKPSINGFRISGNRYGINASASFNASHSVYPLSAIVLELWGLTYAQASARVGKATQADRSEWFTASGSYGLRLTKTNNMSNNMSILFDLDAINAEAYPLDSGGSYPYKLTVTALNGKQATLSGTLKLPQKVTGITADATLDIIQGETAQLIYSVIPSNSELQTVTFSSSDTDTATVDGNGVITAVSEGVCVITAVSNDGGFVAECSVTVTNGDKFPTLTEIRFLGVSEISKIETACKFLADSLGVQLSLPTVAGRNQAVTQIKPIFEGIEDCCQTLRAAAISAGMTNLPIEEQRTISKNNAGGDWFFIVNGWIDLLNSINSQRS